MNRIIIFLVALITLGCLPGCKKFLERPPEGKIQEEDALSTEEGVLAFLNASYTKFNGGHFYGGRLQVLKELLADHLEGQLLTEDFGEIYRRKTSIFGAFKNDFYMDACNIVYRSNTIMKYLDKTGSQRNNIEGQAKFLRGVAFFEIVRLFAQPYGSTPDNTHPGIPIRLQPGITNLDRVSVKDAYNQVITDLTDAARLLPESNGANPTKYAALAFLAKVYFQMNDFAKAYSFADQVLSVRSGADFLFKLDADLTNRYSIGKCKEAIFIASNQMGQFEPGDELRGNFRSDVSLPVLKYSSRTLSLFGRAGDKRRVWLNDTKYPSNIVLTKYNLPQFDLPIVTVTELKLIRAEAAGELNQNLDIAKADLSDILTRAGLAPLTNADASLVISTARQERELELVGEGSRLNEIKRIGVRNNMNVDRRGSPWNCNGFILQFPDLERASNANFHMNPEGGCF